MPGGLRSGARACGGSRPTDRGRKHRRVHRKTVRRETHHEMLAVHAGDGEVLHRVRCPDATTHLHPWHDIAVQCHRPHLLGWLRGGHQRLRQFEIAMARSVQLMRAWTSRTLFSCTGFSFIACNVLPLSTYQLRLRVPSPSVPQNSQPLMVGFT